MNRLAALGGSAHSKVGRLRPRRLFPVALLAALAVPLVPATPAIADEPEHTYGGQEVTSPIPFGPTCGGFAPLITFTSEYNIINFYDDGGRLVKQIRHVTFTGTLYNSADLSKSVPYEGDFTRTLDAVEATATFTGMHFRIPSLEGVLALDVGREIVDLVANEQTFFDGNHNLADFNTEVCRMLG